VHVGDDFQATVGSSLIAIWGEVGLCRNFSSPACRLAHFEKRDKHRPFRTSRRRRSKWRFIRRAGQTKGRSNRANDVRARPSGFGTDLERQLAVGHHGEMGRLHALRNHRGLRSNAIFKRCRTGRRLSPSLRTRCGQTVEYALTSQDASLSSLSGSSDGIPPNGRSMAEDEASLEVAPRAEARTAISPFIVPLRKVVAQWQVSNRIVGHA
jgi:hypothetical protein